MNKLDTILGKIIEEIEKEGSDYAEGDGYKIGLNSALEIIRNFNTQDEVFSIDGITKTCNYCGVRQIPAHPLCREGRPETWEVHIIYLEPKKKDK